MVFCRDIGQRSLVPAASSHQCRRRHQYLVEEIVEEVEEELVVVDQLVEELVEGVDLLE
jgi:hypothetical protein